MTSGTIYLVTRTSDGKSYVGMTSCALSKRWANHLSNSKKRLGALSRAIDDAGRIGFTIHEIETGVPLSLLLERERLWIEWAGTLAPNGFNGNAGGAPGPRGFRSNGDRTREIMERHGVSSSTATRWQREGRNTEKGRSKQAHGASGTASFRKWHRMSSGAGMCEEWRDFGCFAQFYAPMVGSKRQLRRIDKTQPWGPFNCYSPI